MSLTVWCCVIATLLFQVQAIQLTLTPASITVGDSYVVTWQRDAGDPDQFPLRSIDSSGGVGTPIGLVLSKVSGGFTTSGKITSTALTAGPFRVVAVTDSSGTNVLASSNQIIAVHPPPPTSNNPSGASVKTETVTSVVTTSQTSSTSTSSQITSSSTSSSTSSTNSSTSSTSSSTSSTSSPTSLASSSSPSSPTSPTAASSETTSAPSEPTSSSSNSKTPLIVGLVVGIFAVLLIVAVAIVFCLRRRKRTALDVLPEPYAGSTASLNPRRVSDVNHPTSEIASPMLTTPDFPSLYNSTNANPIRDHKIPFNFSPSASTSTNFPSRNTGAEEPPPVYAWEGTTEPSSTIANV